MNNRLLVAPSPHIHSGNKTSKLMRGVLIALLPTMVVSTIYYGWAAIYITAVAVASCVAFEWLIEKFLLKRPSTIGDGSAILTGVLLSFNLPASVPAWLVILGCLFAIGVAKMSYGGLGCNLFNPALVGRVFLLISFPVMMTTFPLSLRNSPIENVQTQPFEIETNFLSTDAVSGATPLAQARTALARGENIDQSINQISIKDMVLGNRTGSYGEAATLALLLGFLYMLYKKIITWHIPIAILGSMFLFSAIFWLIDPLHYINPIFQILTGGALLGAIFMATDYVTSPMTHIGMLIYGVMIGVITILVRTWGGYPEGISFAILLMNAATPLLNKIKPVKFGKI
ncbi:MAG: RnfABCDGE type electron transport complex subunit D [Rikenellaceae bacterium]